VIDRRQYRGGRVASWLPSGSRPATQRIVESITAAIVERRLAPGTKLAEQKIADIFKVSRTLVRQALNQLSRDRLVTLEPSRGARVAEPSVEERWCSRCAMIEAALVPAGCANHRCADRKRVRTCATSEASAPMYGPTRLLADFRVLARLLGNEVWPAVRPAQPLVDPLMYQPAHLPSIHRTSMQIVKPGQARCARRVRLMEHHPSSVERTRSRPRTLTCRAAA
jgi:DNA-binding transcriptional regulator YhcF (GntR family)